MKLNNNDDSHNSGLNLLIYNMLLDIESHPAWVCGLKLLVNQALVRVRLSHPAWVCGLKQSGHTITYDCGVTPCVGVWIETSAANLTDNIVGVTPCVGVWIETEYPCSDASYSVVTPCVGVWIETC